MSEPAPRPPSCIVSSAGGTQAVVDVLRSVEGLSPSASGALLFEHTNRDTGVVLVDRGKVCWAAVARSGTRLRQLLAFFGREQTPRLIARDLEAALGGGPTGLPKDLEQRCAIEPTNLRKAFRQHTVESIARIRPGSAAHWVPHKRGSYKASFTFGTAELLATWGMLQHPGHTALVRFHVQDVLRSAGTGLAFVRAGGAPTLVAATRADGVTVAEAMRTGAVAAELLDVTQIVDPSRRAVVRLIDADRAFIAWEYERAICVNYGIGARTVALHLATVCATLAALEPPEVEPLPSFAPTSEPRPLRTA